MPDKLHYPKLALGARYPQQSQVARSPVTPAAPVSTQTMARYVGPGTRSSLRGGSSPSR